jgi:hypothetical protein
MRTRLSVKFLRRLPLLFTCKSIVQVQRNYRQLFTVRGVSSRLVSSLNVNCFDPITVYN